MFVSPRGTSGSGKTVLARLVLKGTGVYGPAKPHYIDGRKKPIYYVRPRLDGGRPMAILGSYVSVTGGADTISSNDIPFEIARKLDSEGVDTFCEGLLHSAEQHRTRKLHDDGIKVHLYYFKIPLEECLDGVRARRAARGNTTPLNPETTASRHRAIRLHGGRFSAAGVSVVYGTRAEGIDWLYSIGLVDLSCPLVAQAMAGNVQGPDWIGDGCTTTENK